MDLKEKISKIIQETSLEEKGDQYRFLDKIRSLFDRDVIEHKINREQSRFGDGCYVCGSARVIGLCYNCGHYYCYLCWRHEDTYYEYCSFCVNRKSSEYCEWEQYNHKFDDIPKNKSRISKHDYDQYKE